MQQEPVYRDGTIADKDELIRLGVAAFSRHEPAIGADAWAQMRRRLSDEQQMSDLLEKAATFVCTDGGTVIGMAFLLPSGNPTEMFSADWCYIRLVSVAPGYEGRGIGRRLTQLCLDHARRSGEHTIALHTSEFQDAARHIYESTGFRILKELDPRYGKRFWIYTLSLT